MVWSFISFNCTVHLYLELYGTFLLDFLKVTVALDKNLRLLVGFYSFHFYQFFKNCMQYVLIVFTPTTFPRSSLPSLITKLYVSFFFFPNQDQFVWHKYFQICGFLLKGGQITSPSYFLCLGQLGEGSSVLIAIY